MRQFIVRVDGPPDFGPFLQSMQDWNIPCTDAGGFEDWLDDVEAEKSRPVDARYYLVLAETEAVIHEAVEKTAAYARDKWPEGRPVYSVLADREPPSFPAVEI
jgi:hypothetical protein